MGRFGGKTCRLLIMFVLTLAFFLLEVVYGYITNSVALIADSFHMLSDVLALVVAFICMKASKLKRTPRNTFGWARAEVLGALVNTVFLIALSFSIILEAIQRFFQVEYIRDPVNVLIVGSAGLVVNLIGLALFHGHGGHGHSHGRVHSAEGKHAPVWQVEANGNCVSESGADKKGKTAEASSGQMNMRGVWLHVLGDAFGSVVVIINALVNWQTDVRFFKLYLDPMLSLVLSGIIICTSIPLLKQSSLVLMQTVPPNMRVAEIEEKLLSYFGYTVESVHDLHVWNLTGDKVVGSVHIRCRKEVQSPMQLAKELKAFFHYEGIHSTTIQLETAELECNEVHHCALKCPTVSSSECDEDSCCTTTTTTEPVALLQRTMDAKKREPLDFPKWHTIHI